MAGVSSRQQPGCSGVLDIAINHVTDALAENNWSPCVLSAGAADANTAARAALHGWTLDPDTQRVHLTWTERNGPEVHAPESFGTRLIETLGKQLKGDVHLTYEPAGFVYAFEVPLASLTSAAE